MSRSCLVLCEDEQQSAFICRFLTKKGIPVEYDFAPPGKGSGEQYVRENYPGYLELARKKNRPLVVMIDGDNLGADKHLRQLEEECQKQGVDKRGKGEAIAIFVPEPDVEKWIRNLGVGNLRRARDCAPAVKKLSDICASGGELPGDFPSSLRAACDEWRQFRKVAP